MANQGIDRTVVLMAKGENQVVTLSRNELIEILKTLEGLKRKIQPLITKT